MESPRTLQDAIIHFKDFANCKSFMTELRWPDGKVKCPQCGSEHVIWLEKARVWKCYGKHSRSRFSLKSGTIFEDSPLGLDKWLGAVWLVVNCKNGISSYEVSRDLGVSQKSTWFMDHRIRFALHRGSFDAMLGGNDKEVEADETFVGGKIKNMHKARKVRAQKSGQKGDKTIVMGILERGGEVRTKVINDRKKKAVQTELRKHVEVGSKLYTDALQSYTGLTDYNHEVIDHALEYVRGKVHTNGMENFWSLVKRSLKGTYISVEPFHLFRYLDEQVYRYNNRKDEEGSKVSDFERFRSAMSQIVGKRITWNELTGKQGQPLSGLNPA